MNYQAGEIEEKWQKKWEDSGLYNVDLESSKKPKYYNLVMFPYPSGDKLHVGHWYNYGPADSFGRFKRLQGFNVFEPMGYDSFGLPAENYAIKTGVPPKESTEKNIELMTKQLKRMGTMYDWDKSVVTSRPEYYKWTQAVFLDLYEKGLAYKKEAPVNWCPGCQTVLANEQVQDGVCERCGSEVTKKFLNQWFFKISEYAEDLLQHEGLDWPEKTVLMQKNWIGKSEGSEITFQIADSEKSFKVFTTRIDTLYGCTYAVLAPEHPLVQEIVVEERQKEVEDYIQSSLSKSDIDRTAEGKEKSGVFTGAFAINPVNGKKVPLWIADYVLGHYGTGAVMAVPAHDERDFEFAKRYGLEIKVVIHPDAEIDRKTKVEDVEAKTFAYTEYGILVNSGGYDGLKTVEAKKAITSSLNKNGQAEFIINYRLRDWLISRQRYWGAPIPIVNCATCGEMPVPVDMLPVELPENLKNYKPEGKSPLEDSEEFMNTTCPKCGEKATREADTMDTFMCSSWYFLRYLSSDNQDQAFDKTTVDKWMPVDMYIGGPEHACMHLLYARFIHKVLMNDRKSEPFKKLVHQGLITKDGAKMSKSKGNVVSPDEFVGKYGSDVFRMYLMFMGPFTEGGDWSDKGITGIARFVDRFWKLINQDFPTLADEKEMIKRREKLIKKVGEDIEVFQFNTAIAAMMEFLNFAVKNGVDRKTKEILTVLISPMAPHLAEECFEFLGHTESIFDQSWPKYDASKVVDDEVKIGVQVNGKVRGEITISADAGKDDVLQMARVEPNVAKYLEQGQVIKEIFVPGKIVGFVVK